MDHLICSSCGAENPADGKFCQRCGQPLLTLRFAPEPQEESVYCAICGAKQPSGNGICASCGNPLTRRESKASPQDAEPAQSRSAQPERSNLGLWIAIAVASVVLLALIVILALHWNAWFGGETQAQTPLASEQDAPETEPVAELAEPGSPDSAAVTLPALTDTKETQAAGTGYTAEQAEALISQRYACVATLIDEDEATYTFECGHENWPNAYWGRVGVDKRNGELHVLDGMRPSKTVNISASRVENLVRGMDADASYSFAVIDLYSGELIGSENCELPFSSSVLIDVPILFTVNNRIENGSLSLQTKIPVHITSGGRGELTQADEGKELSLKELVAIMFRSSDNNATNSFMDYLKLDGINRTCNDEGFYSVKAANHIGATEDYTDNDNYVSASDLCRMLYRLYNTDDGLGRDFLFENLAVKDGTQDTGLNKYIASDKSLSFNGRKDSKYNEIVIYEQGDSAYAIALLSNSTDLTSLQSIAAAIGSYLFETLK